MPAFYVTYRRTEEITFRIEATDADDAEARFLADGDEVYADLVNGGEVTAVELVDETVAV